MVVIVILGIIAAIAIPSIGGLIDNSKKDAHVANAQQMINAAKIAVTADKSLIPANGKAKTISLEYLEDNGYLETVKDPDGGTYTRNNNGGVSADLDITGTPVKDGTINEPNGDSYVVIINDNTKFHYRVKLVNGNRGVQTAGKAVKEEDLKRSEVRNQTN